jgi:mono/diheme cytochrome c family protein
MNNRIAGVLLVIIFSVWAGNSKAQAKKSAPTRSISVVTLNKGREVYTNTCLPCHMADGGGVPRMNPPLTGTTYVLGDKTKLIGIVLNGFSEDVEIDGQRYANTMPPQTQLTDAQVADVLTYVRNSFGNKASAVTLAEVKAVRGGTKKVIDITW